MMIVGMAFVEKRRVKEEESRRNGRRMGKEESQEKSGKRGMKKEKAAK